MNSQTSQKHDAAKTSNALKQYASLKETILEYGLQLAPMIHDPPTFKGLPPVSPPRLGPYEGLKTPRCPRSDPLSHAQGGPHLLILGEDLERLPRLQRDAIRTCETLHARREDPGAPVRSEEGFPEGRRSPDAWRAMSVLKTKQVVP